jgi:hypothetical protein
MKIEIALKDPAKELPPLNTDILAVVESSIDRGHGFKRHQEFRVLRILPEDVDGDEDEGAAIYAKMEAGETQWEEGQLRLEAGIEELDFYSDSIAWWAEMPTIPTPDDFEQERRAQADADADRHDAASL